MNLKRLFVLTVLGILLIGSCLPTGRTTPQGANPEQGTDTTEAETPTAALLPPETVLWAPDPLRDPAEEQMAWAIIRWKNKVSDNGWWECGRRYTEEEMLPAAREWSEAIYAAHNKYTYDLYGMEFQVSLSDIVGTMMNESGFDRCAVGPHPRNFALEHGLILPSKHTISYSLETWKKVFEHPLFKEKKVDLGPGQIVKRVKGRRGLSWEQITEYMSVSPGVDIVVKEMARRGAAMKTASPSEHWPGTIPQPSYRSKVYRMAKRLLY